MFKPGKNRDGYFKAEDLIAQVDRAMDIFEAKTNGLAQGLFMFDNAPSHLKRADDAISSRKMVKSALLFFFMSLFLIDAPPRSQAPLGTCSERPTHARRLQSLDTRATVFLFSQRPPSLSRVVQGDGVHYSRARPLA